MPERHSRKFLGSSVVRVSDLEENPHPDRFHAWCPLCFKKQKELQGTVKFSEEAPEQTLLQYRLKAAVSAASWGDRELKELVPCGGEFRERWQVQNFCITEGIPFLNLIKSLSIRKKRLLYPLLKPWILVDFYEHGELFPCCP